MISLLFLMIVEGWFTIIDHFFQYFAISTLLRVFRCFSFLISMCVCGFVDLEMFYFHILLSFFQTGIFKIIFHVSLYVCMFI